MEKFLILWKLYLNFNHVTTHFVFPKKLVCDHEIHFENELFRDIASQLGFIHNLSIMNPQANGYVEAINKILKTMLQRIVEKHKPIGNTCFS